MLKPFPSSQVPKAGLSCCKNNKYKRALYSSDCPEKASVTSPASQWDLMPCRFFVQRNFISSASLALIYGAHQLYGLCEHAYIRIYRYVCVYIYLSIHKPLFVIPSLWMLEQCHEFMIQTAKQIRQLRQLEDVSEQCYFGQSVSSTQLISTSNSN